MTVPGSQELLVIALVALFVLGPERLPGLARSAARGLTRVRNYGVTASKELRGVADLGEIEREVTELRRELERTRTDLRRAMRDTVASSPSSSRRAPRAEQEPAEDPASSPSSPPSTPSDEHRINGDGRTSAGDTPSGGASGGASGNALDSASDMPSDGDEPTGHGA